MIQKITTHYISLLPQGYDFYKPQYLQEYGFPPFLVHQMGIELKKKIAESVPQPQTVWVDMQSTGIQQSWQQFTKVMQAESKIPANNIRPFVEEAVAKVLHLLTEPRKTIPAILFDEQESLSASLLEKRLEQLVVYPHFAQILRSYMERKGRDTLDRQRCEQIISDIDEKLTTHYSPLQWAQLLDPLFTLAGRQIDADLFRAFFNDKEMEHAAHQFGQIDTAINRDRFIEILTANESPEWNDDQPEEEELPNTDATSRRPHVLLDAPVATDSNDPEEQRQRAEFNKPEPVKTDPRETTPDHSETHEEETPEAVPTNGHPEHASEPSPQKNEREEEKAEKDDYASLNTIFEQKSSSPKSPTKQAGSLNDLFAGAEQEEREAEPQQASHHFAEPESEESSSQKKKAMTDEITQRTVAAEKAEKSQESASIWQQFATTGQPQENESVGQQYQAAPEAKQPEDTAELQTDPQPESQPKAESQPQPEPEPEPKTQPKPKHRPLSEQEKVARLLGEQKNYFVHYLFEGSGRDYEEFIREVANQKEWKGASALIKKDIFERDGVNMYSEAAVEFTDRLQTYFSRK